MYSAAAAIGGLDDRLRDSGTAARPPRQETPEQRPAEPSLEPGDPLAALLARIALGEQAALESLYDLTLPRVFAVARRICSDAALAEEVAEDVYFQVWREAARFDSARAPALPWLLMMTRSRALDALRRTDRALLTDDPHALAGEECSGDGDPLRLLEAFRRDGEVRAALARLPARDRQIVALAFLRGLTHAQIAAAMRLPLGTVKTAVRRALHALRITLAAHAPDGCNDEVSDGDD
ncbi:MAG: sigma-70 family RNA polymerase sigma factor [Pseudomonadota bacterium]